MRAPLGLVFSLSLLLAGCPGDDPGEDAGTGSDGATTSDGASSGDGSVTESCVVLQTLRRECTRASGNATLLDVYTCEEGVRLCYLPSPYNETDTFAECVDNYRFERVHYPATCVQVDDFLAGRLECLVPSHCSGNPDDPGDWMCSLSEGCVCPFGGRCPTPTPAPGRDAGVADGGASPDAGSTGLDAGPTPTDAGSPPTRDAGPAPMDAGSPPARDAGTPPARDAGAPTPADSGGPAPPGS